MSGTLMTSVSVHAYGAAWEVRPVASTPGTVVVATGSRDRYHTATLYLRRDDLDLLRSALDQAAAVLDAAAAPAA